MKKHILILGCKNYPAFSSKKVISGGMEVYVTEIINNLKHDFRFTVIAGYSYSDDVEVKVRSVPLIGKFALQSHFPCFSILSLSLVWGVITGS